MTPSARPKAVRSRVNSGSDGGGMAFVAAAPAATAAAASLWATGIFGSPPRRLSAARPARPPLWVAVASQPPPAETPEPASATAPGNGSDAAAAAAAAVAAAAAIDDGPSTVASLGLGDDGDGGGGASLPPELPPLAGTALGTSLAFGSHRMRVFSGTSNPDLANAVARYLGKPAVNPILHKKFADGETYVRIEESVRGTNVFLIQSTSNPANDHYFELLLMIDACRRAHAAQVTCVLPYYGYSRADRLIDPDRRRREALTSKLVSNMLTTAGADRIVLLDIHSPQSCGFFDIPVDHIYGSGVLVDYLRSKNLDDMVIVAPDVGGVARARAFAKDLNDAPLAIIDKRREAHNVSKVLNLVGDVRGKTAVIVDDMIDTGGTIHEGAKMLAAKGARQVFAVCTHAIFSGPAVQRLSSGAFQEVIVTDSIHLPPEKRFEQLRILSVAPIIGETIWRVNDQSSR